MATWERFAEFFGSYYTLFIAIVAHCNVFLACMSYAWPSPVLPKLFEPTGSPLGHPITPSDGDLIAAIFYIGATAGPLLLYGIVGKVGRRKVLIGISFIPAIAYTILVFANTVTAYNICRVLLGLSVGILFSVEPVYVCEILADEERSFLMSLLTIFGFSGAFSTMSIGPFVSVPVFNGIIASFSIVIALLMFFGFPETPCFLLKKEGEESTRELLKKLRNQDVEEELNQMCKTMADELSTSCCEIFSTLQNVKAFILSTLPLLLQSYSGIALILNYSQLIFMETNVDVPAEWCAIIVIGFTLSTTFLTPLLMSKKVPIYTLLIYCLSGIAVCDFFMGMYFMYGRNNSSFSWVPLVILVCFVLIYNTGLDSIPWMLLGESYPPNISAVGTAISTSIFELSIFPSLFFFHKIEPSHLFLFCSGFSFFGVMYFTFFIVPGEKKKNNEIKTIA